MKKRDAAPPIIYSTDIEKVIQFFKSVQEKYHECGEYMVKSNDETQDILHTMELCTCTVQERNKLFNKASEIRRNRRAAKNEESVLSPIISWCRNHEKELKSLEELLGAVRNVEDKVNNERFYRNRTSVIEDLFGERSIIDIPDERIEALPQQSEEEALANATILPEETYDEYPNSKIQEGRVEKILRYPVVIYHTRKKKSGTYYYIFPGVESPVVPHAFNSGDPVMNIKNKKLMSDIATTFNEVMIRHRRSIPFPLSTENINPSLLKNGLHISSITETRIVYQEYKCFCKEEDMGEKFPLI